MKLTNIILGLIASAVIVSGCSNKQASSDAPANTVEAQSADNTKAESAKADETAKSAESAKTDETAKADESAKADELAKADESAKSDDAVDMSTLKVGSQNIKIENERYLFGGSYPTFGVKAIDDNIKSTIDGIINEEIKSFLEIAEDENHMTVDVQFENYRATKDNIDFYVFFDRTISGFAHPSSNIYTFSFDTKTGKRLQLEDFIASGELSIDYLSRETRRLLPGIIKKDVDVDVTAEDIKYCTAPKAENFRHILRRCCDKEGFTVIYEPGEVMGPYNSMITVEIDPMK